MHDALRATIDNWLITASDDEIAEALADPYWERYLSEHGVPQSEIEHAKRKFSTACHRTEFIQEVDPDLERLLMEEESIEARTREAHARMTYEVDTSKIEDGMKILLAKMSKPEELYGPIDLEYVELEDHLRKRHDMVFTGHEDKNTLEMMHRGFHRIAEIDGVKPHKSKKKKGKKR